ncbi:MAG: hypothetical protein ACJ8H8_27525 [Geminicoccaceae bacterium]
MQPLTQAVLGYSSVLLLGLTPIAERPAMLDYLPERDVHTLFAAAEASGRVGIARKTKLVDARPARPGEVIVTHIAGEGHETRSKPAATGDWVVRNRGPATGTEKYLVQAKTFAERYEGPLSDPDGEGWREFRPRGPEMRYFTLTEADGAFRFTAPWGEQMRARPGDAIVRNPSKPDDTYRVAAAAFACTYEVVAPPGRK